MENKNLHISQLDTDQMLKRTFDETCDAQRVVLITGEIPTSNIVVDIDSTKITDAIRAGLKLDQFENSSKIERIEVPVIVKEYQTIEVPVITKEIEYREIKVPYEVVRIIEIEKPTIIKETVFEKIEINNKKELMYLTITCILEFLAILVLLYRK